MLVLARAFSSIFRPIYYPTVGMFLMFTLLRLCPLHSRTLELLGQIEPWMLLVTFVITLCLPYGLVWLYRRFNHWPEAMLRLRPNRTIPHFIYMSCYFLCVYIIGNMFVPFLRSIPMLRTSIDDPFTYADAISHLMMPRCFVSIFFIALAVQCVCSIINMVWKVSTHAAGSGAVIGALLGYSEFFGFYPLWWLCLALLLSGCVMSSRMILRQHTLAQVMVGTFVGIVCAYGILKLTLL